jgi:hypothetical protein
MLGERLRYNAPNGSFLLGSVGVVNSAHKKMFLVNENEFEKLIPENDTTQVSVYITDYSYTDRVVDRLGDLGYIAFSPFRIGAVMDDTDLVIERIVTLTVCIAVFILTAILQFILIKAMFNSYIGHFKLMSNIGLTAKTAYASVALMMLIYTIIGQILGLCSIIILNELGISYVVSIFKYLEFGNIFVLVLAHFLICALSLVSVCKSLKKQVFKSEKADEDIDFVIASGVKAND